ncbi:MAG: diphthine--ammonia ligase [Acidobacteria bacterium]|nr:MAG: diphthine--ammonia ligase [Acidobacteriota bacterium]
MEQRKEKIVLSWSGGKDSVMALYELLKVGSHEIVALLTTVTETVDRISMHGVRRSLLQRQAEALGFPLHIVSIPPRANNAIYEARMEEMLVNYQRRGIRQVAFGDIFLKDIRAYREGNLARVGLRAVFPLWKRETHQLARTFIKLGFRAIVTCIDPRALDPSFVGRLIDGEFLRELPSTVDPCGENGEFHSFVFDGPIFRQPVTFSLGEKVERDAFWFCDLLPVDEKAAP